MAWEVPLTEVTVTEDDIEAVLDCLRSGWLTMGPRTAAFEEELADFTGSRHAVAVCNGTAALHLSLLAAGIGPGDEVLVPAMTFVASASSVRMVGAEPVFCDVRGPENPNLDPGDVEARITPRTKAVMPVHWFGYPADLSALRKLCDHRGLLLIEDAAQAVGAMVDDSGRRVGTIGALGCFSLFSKKQLCVGEGGFVTTDDDELATRLRSLRSHAMTSVTWDRHRGHANTYDIVDIGFNYRLDEPRAALGLSRLARLEADIAVRREAVRAYRERLRGRDGLGLMFDDDEQVDRSSHFAFAVLLDDRVARDAFRSALRDRGVQTTWYPAVHRFTEYQTRYGELSLPGVEATADRHCVLPLASTTTTEEVERVVDIVDAVLAA